MLHAKYIRGALAYWETHLKRIIHAIGVDVKNYELRTADLNATTVDPSGWTATVVEIGAGTSEFDANDEVDRIGTITCAANEDDGAQYQLLGESFMADGSRDFYGGVKLQSNDVDQTDFLFGFCITDASVLGGMTDGIYLESLDGSALVSAVTEKGSSETQSDSLATLEDDVDVILEVYFEGATATAYFFINGVQVAAHTLDVPDDQELRLTLAFLTGEGIANTCNVGWLRASQFS